MPIERGKFAYSDSASEASYWFDQWHHPALSVSGVALPTYEVGAIAQGILDAKLLQQTEMLVHAILDYLDAINQGIPFPVPSSLTLYQAISVIDYPRNSLGELQAIIHPQLQFKDYEPLQNGALMFLSFTGESIPYQGETVVHPVFINEAAYYEERVALILTEKQQVDLKADDFAQIQ